MTAPVRTRAWLGPIALILSAASSAEDGLPRTAPGSSIDHDDSYAYRLPYGDGVSFRVLQAYGSKLSHQGVEHYTIDFEMPEGTIVFSAREGTVVETEDRFDISCWHERCGRFANFVEIRHDDGTLAKYFHLERGSILVEPGQRVARGVAIARSGDTGYSNVPHLHFGVYGDQANGEERSIAIRFDVRGGLVGSLRTGARYTNRPE